MDGGIQNMINDTRYCILRRFILYFHRHFNSHKPHHSFTFHLTSTEPLVPPTATA